MKNNYTDDELKADVEKTIGIRAKDIEKICLVGLWHIRFRAFGNDFYYYIADSESQPVLKQDDFNWSLIEK